MNDAERVAKLMPMMLPSGGTVLDFVSQRKMLEAAPEKTV